MALYLIALVGVPGSGKSTITANTALPVVSSDTVRCELLGSDADQSRPADIWAEVHRRLTNHLAAGESVILDATNVDPAYRAPLLTIARAAGATPVAWRITTPHAESREANRRRTRVVPDEVMDRMIGHFRRYCTTAALTAEGWTVRNIATAARPDNARLLFGEGAR